MQAPCATPPIQTAANSADDAVDTGQQYRQALSCFGTGVTVVSSHWDRQDWAMTCNSFASVSLNPRLVLWSIRREASSLDAFTRSGGFSVSVLSQAQQGLARQFASGSMSDRFSGVPVEREVSGRLRLSQALAWFDCDLHQTVEAGDHYVLIGSVKAFGQSDAKALGFWRSRFVQFEGMAA